MTPLLQIDTFSLSFISPETQEENLVLREINLQIRPGETHALVGESGSGKSITALSILRLPEESSRVHSSGLIRFEDQDMASLSHKALRAIRGNRIAMIFQEPMTSLNPVYTIGNQLMEPLTLHQGLSKPQAHAQALHLLSRTGIDQPERRINSYPHQLSGGQRQRVIIAMALACRPSLLIADEPTTALDLTVQGQILALIRDIQQEYGMAMLLISHDLPMVSTIADSISIMQEGRILEQGKAADLLSNPQHSYTKRLLAAIPNTTQPPRPNGPPLLSLRDIHCTFPLKTSLRERLRGQRRTFAAVDGISLTLYQGTTLGVVGESGSGKSTLALCLLNLIRSTGEALYFPKDGAATINLSTLSARRFRPLRRELQIVFQDPFSSLSPRMTIEQIITEGLEVHGLGRDRAKRSALVEEALRDVELDPTAAGRFPHEFSGGQRQRIAIARALILRPRLLILDEPTSALDMTIQKQILELLRRLQEQYQLSYIFITHDLRTVRAMADQLVVMRHGRIVESGPAAALFADPQEAYTKELFQAAFPSPSIQ